MIDAKHGQNIIENHQQKNSDFVQNKEEHSLFLMTSFRQEIICCEVQVANHSQYSCVHEQVAEQVHGCEWVGEDCLVETELYTILATIALNKQNYETVRLTGLCSHSFEEMCDGFLLPYK